MTINKKQLDIPVPADLDFLQIPANLQTPEKPTPAVIDNPPVRQPDTQPSDKEPNKKQMTGFGILTGIAIMIIAAV